ncbi:hypothetical protein V7152_07875 [Neobacillus drentensis]|uniref:hypothetical protein n=1 Tax=Neobacillus drentensis TaxID=220684 RepID=UPI002FFEFE0F
MNNICQSDTILTKELQSWEEGLLKSLGLIDLIGKVVPEDPIEQMNKMLEKIAKEKDGEIISSP